LNGNILKTIKLVVFLHLVLFPVFAYAGTVKVALLPWKVSSAQNAEFLKGVIGDMLSTKIGRDASRVEVLKGEPVINALAGAAGDITDTTARAAGNTLGADYCLYGSLFVIENSVNVEARLVKTSDASATPFSSIAQGTEAIIALTDKLSADVLAVVAAPSGAVKKQESFIIKADDIKEKPVFWKSAALDGLFVSMDSADMDGDGVKELLLVSNKRLVIARVNRSFINEKNDASFISGKNDAGFINKKKDDAAVALETIKEIKAASGVDFVSVGAADTDGDGVPEAYVSGFDGERPAGLAVEYKEKDYTVTAKGIKWFMRAVGAEGTNGRARGAEGTNGRAQDETGGRRIIGQRFRDTDGFYGPLIVLKKQGNSVVEAGAYGPLPSRSDIFRFGVLDLTGSGAPELVSLDQRGYLRIFRKEKAGKWKEGFKSKDYYGGTLNTLEFREDRPGASSKEPVQIEGRWVYGDLDKDGKTDIILKRNTPGGLGRVSAQPMSFIDGVIMSLSWDKTTGTLAENWKTRQITGYIADFFINRETGELIVLATEDTDSLTSGVKSYILIIPLSL